MGTRGSEFRCSVTQSVTIPDLCNMTNNLASVYSLCPTLMPSAVYNSILFLFLPVSNHMPQL